jgi:hypothetical protein
MRRHGIGLTSTASRAETQGLLVRMGVGALNNDRVIVASAFKNGLKFATSDQKALNAARRLGVDVKAWRLIDNGTAANWYTAVVNALTKQGVANPQSFIGPLHPWP